jgi:hypothetical protein
MRRFEMLTGLCLALALALGGVGSSKTIYVDDDAPPGGDGKSWATAYRYLQDALHEAKSSAEQPPRPKGGVRTLIAMTSDANNSPASVQIRVAQGIYEPDQGANQTAGDRRASFELSRGVSLRGSYGGLGRPDPNSRDIALHETILSGDLAGNDVGVSDPCDLEDEPSRADNTYHVVHIENADDTFLLEGFTVTGGYAWVTGGPGPDSPSGPYMGGGVRCVRSDDPTIAKCTFRGNFAEMGGGMVNSSNAKVIECVFLMNAACAQGGEGGGILTGGKATIERCRFIGNQASGGGAMAAGDSSEATVTESVFMDNIASGGGAVISVGGSEAFRSCSFIGNSALSGGGLRNVGNRMELVNCLFCSNKAETRGGAIDNNANRILLIQNCTFVGNSSPSGNAMSLGKNISVSSSILWDGGQEMHDISSIAVAYSNVQGSWPGEGNINVDPLFADADNNDYHLKSQGGRWDRANDTWTTDDVISPCIDAGDPNSPIGQEPFPNGGRINMGAYGGTVEASKSYFGEAPCERIIAGDINGDCRVDFVDLGILADHWLEEG